MAVKRAETAEQVRERAEARADRAEVGRDAERSRADALRDEIGRASCRERVLNLV